MKHILNEVFDKIYVINLKKDKIKRKLMKNQLNKLGIRYSFFKAVDGKKTSYKKIYENYLLKKIKYEGCHELEIKLNKKVLTSYGSFGILKTMEKLLKNAIENNYKKILTLQDDIIFDKNFNLKIGDYLSKIPDWKILSLGVSQHMWNNVQIIKNKKYYKTPYYTDGAFALGLDHTIFKQILNNIRKFNCNFDSGPIRSIYKKYPNECFTLYPNLIIARLDSSSTQKYRDIKKIAISFSWNLENFDLKNIYIKYNTLKIFKKYWLQLPSYIHKTESGQFISSIIDTNIWKNKKKVLLFAIENTIKHYMQQSSNNKKIINIYKNILAQVHLILSP